MNCCIPQCNQKPAPNVSLHMLPNNPKMLKKWKIALKISKPKVHDRVCNRHFQKSDYRLQGLSKSHIFFVMRWRWTFPLIKDCSTLLRLRKLLGTRLELQDQWNIELVLITIQHNFLVLYLYDCFNSRYCSPTRAVFYWNRLLVDMTKSPQSARDTNYLSFPDPSFRPLNFLTWHFCLFFDAIFVIST